MKYSELKILARAYAPTATVEQIPDAALSLLLREGALDVAGRTQCLKTFDYFDSEASVGTYNLSTKLEKFLGIEKGGIKWKNGTSYLTVLPRTIPWLEKNRPNWRTETAGQPVYYVMDKANVIFTPKPATAVSDAFLANYFQMPPTPVSDDYYPFGGAVEISHLAPLSECILYYYKWKVLGVLSKPDEMDKFEPVYERECMRKMKLINLRKDIADTEDARLQGRKIR